MRLCDRQPVSVLRRSQGLLFGLFDASVVCLLYWLPWSRWRKSFRTWLCWCVLNKFVLVVRCVGCDLHCLNEISDNVRIEWTCGRCAANIRVFGRYFLACALQPFVVFCTEVVLVVLFSLLRCVLLSLAWVEDYRSNVVFHCSLEGFRMFGWFISS